MPDDRDILQTEALSISGLLGEQALQTLESAIWDNSSSVVGAWSDAALEAIFGSSFSQEYADLEDYMWKILDDADEFFVELQAPAKDDFYDRAKKLIAMKDAVDETLILISTQYTSRGNADAVLIDRANRLLNKLNDGCEIQKRLLDIWQGAYAYGVLTLVKGFSDLAANRIETFQSAKTKEVIDHIHQTEQDLKTAGINIIEVGFQTGLNLAIPEITAFVFALNPVAGLVTGAGLVIVSIAADNWLGPNTSNMHTWSSRLSTSASQSELSLRKAAVHYPKVRPLPTVVGEISGKVGIILDAKEGAEAIAAAANIKARLDALHALLQAYTQEWDALLPMIERFIKTSRQIAAVLIEMERLINEELVYVAEIEALHDGKIYLID